MELRHEGGEIAMGGDEVVAYVARVAGGIAQAGEARDLGEAMQQAGERPYAARTFAVIGVDVLPDQRHLAHARVGEALDFRDDLRDRPRDFRTTGIRND